MDLTIGFLPKKYFIDGPSTGLYPFFVSEKLLYALSIGEMYYPGIPDEQLVLFAESLAQYPLYYLFEARESAFEEIEQQLSKDKLTFEVFHSTLESSYLLVTVFNRAELALLMPTLIWQHNDCMSTFWSPHKHAFTIEKKTWDAKEYPEIFNTICINFNQPTTAFWFGHDFHGTKIFSNEEKYAKLEDVQKRLPSFIKTEVIEFG